MTPIKYALCTADLTAGFDDLCLGTCQLITLRHYQNLPVSLRSGQPGLNAQSKCVQVMSCWASIRWQASLLVIAKKPLSLCSSAVKEKGKENVLLQLSSKQNVLLQLQTKPACKLASGCESVCWQR